MNKDPKGSRSVADHGFTLVELVIAMLLTSVIGIAMIWNYISQQQIAATVRTVSQIQQQLRGAMHIIEQDIRIAGYNLNEGVVDIRRWSISDGIIPALPDILGSPAITVAYDWDPTNPDTSHNGFLDEPTPSYRLFNEQGNGNFDLYRIIGPDRHLVAEGIQAIGFAYAFEDNQGMLVRSAAGDIVWAVDSNNDNRLDTRLDTNGDGVIDENDDSDGDGRITPADIGGALGPVLVDRIRMVRVWILARARNASKDYTANERIVVGDRVLSFNDDIRRRLLVRTVDCRNRGN
jgi:type IV pilus assembly protein PilW